MLCLPQIAGFFVVLWHLSDFEDYFATVNQSSSGQPDGYQDLDKSASKCSVDRKSLKNVWHARDWNTQVLFGPNLDETFIEGSGGLVKQIKAVTVLKYDAGEVMFIDPAHVVTEQPIIFWTIWFSDDEAGGIRSSLGKLLGLENTTIEVTFELPVSRESAHDAGSTCLQMLHDKTFTDCIFKIGDDQIEAHRCILAQRSKVFRAMFSQQSTNEAKNGVIEIKDSDIVSVNAMLEYMYSGAVELTVENVEGVMLLADKYDVKPLTQVCIDCLIDSLSMTNFIRTAVVGDLCSSSTILEKCGEFLKKNRREIFESDEWQEFKNTNNKLAFRLMELSY